MKTIRRLTAPATVTFAVAALLGVRAGAAPAGELRTAAPAYPDSIAVIGHSFATGEGVSGPATDERTSRAWMAMDR